MKKKIEIEIPEGKVAEWKVINGVETLVLVDEVDNRPVTERIKTFEDAIMATGMTIPLDDNQLSYLPKDVVAYMKLRIIAAALNELNEENFYEFPKFTTEEFRYYPWFFIYTQEEIYKMDEEKKKKLWMCGGRSNYGMRCGLTSADSYTGWSYGNAIISARLAVKTEELAAYFGMQFIDIWAEYVTLTSKEE